MWNNYGDPARYHGLMPTVNYGPEEKAAKQIRVHYFCNLKTKYNSPCPRYFKIDQSIIQLLFNFWSNGIYMTWDRLI